MSGVELDAFYKQRERRRRRERASQFVLTAVWILLVVFCLACWWSVFEGVHWLMVHVSR